MAANETDCFVLIIILIVYSFSILKLKPFLLFRQSGEILKELCLHCQSPVPIKPLGIKDGVSNWLNGITHRDVGALRRSDRKRQVERMNVSERFLGLLDQ